MQEANVFIVHLWTAEGSQADFRAAVQRAGADESAWFTQVDALARYLERQASAPASADNHLPGKEQS